MNSEMNKLLALMGTKYKIGFFIVLLLSIVGAIFEIMTIGMVFPLVTVLFSNDPLSHLGYMSKAFKYFNIDNFDQNMGEYVFYFFLVFSVFSMFLRILSIYISSKYSYLLGHQISKKVYSSILRRDYISIKSTGSVEVVSGVVAKINAVIQNLIFPITMLLTSFCMLLIAFSSLLFFSTSSNLILTLFGSISFIYILIVFYFKKKLQYNSKVIAKSQSDQVKLVQEAVGSIKDIILNNSGGFFNNTFSEIDFKLRNKQALNVVIGQSPRYLIETVGVLIIISVAFYSLKDGYDKDILLATFATSAIALQRLLPYINQAYRSWVNISSNIYSFYDVMALINDENSFDESSNKINFYKSLAIKKMSFSYDDGAYILSDIDIDIKKGQKVGFIGVTGCGKSTLVDIIMGLLIPSEGGVYVDDVFISKENVRSWYSLISHVPQNIFILDDTLENNIAFGKNSAQINMELLIQSLKVACLEELLPYIESGKKMGEQGAILSGGQKQRIGIARSIYMQLPIIVFDEATSALDMVTEKRIMENISSLDSSPTILLIAHRLTTLKICDFILEIESGKIKKKMTYDSMV